MWLRAFAGGGKHRADDKHQLSHPGEFNAFPKSAFGGGGGERATGGAENLIPPQVWPGHLIPFVPVQEATAETDEPRETENRWRRTGH